MFPYWPEAAKDPSSTRAEIEFGRAIDSADKVVFSRTFDRIEDGSTRIVRTDLRDEILKLKQEAGKDILTGGVDIPSQLTEMGLVDEYRIVVQPIVAGEGRRLFDGVRMQDRLRLKLTESKVFESGCAALRYLKQ
jgi:dihydrofolate reductase